MAEKSEKPVTVPPKAAIDAATENLLKAKAEFNKSYEDFKTTLAALKTEVANVTTEVKALTDLKEDIWTAATDDMETKVTEIGEKIGKSIADTAMQRAADVAASIEKRFKEIDELKSQYESDSNWSRQKMFFLSMIFGIAFSIAAAFAVVKFVNHLGEPDTTSQVASQST